MAYRGSFSVTADSMGTSQHIHERMQYLSDTFSKVIEGYNKDGCRIKCNTNIQAGGTKPLGRFDAKMTVKIKSDNYGKILDGLQEELANSGFQVKPI